ncbi:MAG: YkgJ family cysteine cluster protein [Planctomycetota bacterium]
MNYTLLSELDAHLPAMRCDRDCDLCCGFVSCSATEFDDVMALARANRIEPRRQGMTCPFYLEGRCSVYAVRPFTCRLFGHVDEASLTCPRGYNTNIAAEEVRRLREGYERERSMAGGRNLHEAVYTELEIAELLLAAVNPAAVGAGPVSAATFPLSGAASRHSGG